MRPSNRPGYRFVIFDHKRKTVAWCRDSFEVANLCASRFMGAMAAIDHELRHIKRERILRYYKDVAGRKG